jgi:hypothetical protein
VSSAPPRRRDDEDEFELEVPDEPSAPAASSGAGAGSKADEDAPQSPVVVSVRVSEPQHVSVAAPRSFWFNVLFADFFVIAETF